MDSYTIRIEVTFDVQADDLDAAQELGSNAVNEIAKVVDSLGDDTYYEILEVVPTEEF